MEGNRNAVIRFRAPGARPRAGVRIRNKDALPARRKACADRRLHRDRRLTLRGAALNVYI